MKQNNVHMITKMNTQLQEKHNIYAYLPFNLNAIHKTVT